MPIRNGRVTRRDLIHTGVAAGVSIGAGFPGVLRSQSALTLDFATIPDPDGWHPSLRLKGDWLIFAVSDGINTGFGEASHSREDERCKELAARLFSDHYRDFALSLESLQRKEAQIAALDPDFVTATAFSGLNQALYDLLAKREQVPVWQLFANQTRLESLPLYTTINRALATRTQSEYLELVGALVGQGFEIFKCAPFERVDNFDQAIEKSRDGIATLQRIRQEFGDVGIRVDFHERFQLADFVELVPELERLRLDWIEEPFAMGPDYTTLQSKTDLRIAGGELFWGDRIFGEIVDNQWVHVIMPDVKHVGGFGPLLSVLEKFEGRTEVSPHNPSGPISTAASLHAAALYPELVQSLEFAFDRAMTRGRTGEIVEQGRVRLTDRPGWGVSSI